MRLIIGVNCDCLRSCVGTYAPPPIPICPQVPGAVGSPGVKLILTGRVAECRGQIFVSF